LNKFRKLYYKNLTHGKVRRIFFLLKKEIHQNPIIYSLKWNYSSYSGLHIYSLEKATLIAQRKGYRKCEYDFYFCDYGH
jgi:hypothetical protein